MIQLFVYIRKKRLLLSIIPLFAVLLAALILFRKEKVLFPIQGNERTILPYTDKQFDNGISTIDSVSIHDDSVFVSYTLIDSNKALVPFGGIALMDSNLQENFNPFSYEKIRVKVSSKEYLYGNIIFTFSTGKDLPIDDPEGYILMKSSFTVFPHKNEYTLSLDGFVFDDSWLRKSGYSFEEVQKMKLNRLWNIFVDLSNSNNENGKNSFTLKGVSFFNSYIEDTIWGAGFLGFYYLLLWGIVAMAGKHLRLLSQREKIELPYKTIEIIDTNLADLKRIIDNVQENFSREEYSLQEFTKAVSLSQERVQNLLKSHFNGVTFAKYLNSVRISEACHLLCETDLKVSDISDAVGYTTITHFNRTFKQIKLTTPSQFRETHRVV